MPYKDPEQAKEYKKKWQEENREKVREHSRRWREENREKQREYNRQWSEENREKSREYARKYSSNPDNKLKIKRNKFKLRYNATDEQFDAYMAITHCQLCNRELSNEPRLSTTRCQDHCHTTGKLRKVLCLRCNVTEGNYKDDPEQLLKLYEYIKQNTHYI